LIFVQGPKEELLIETGKPSRDYASLHDRILFGEKSLVEGAIVDILALKPVIREKTQQEPELTKPAHLL